MNKDDFDYMFSAMKHNTTFDPIELTPEQAKTVLELNPELKRWIPTDKDGYPFPREKWLKKHGALPSYRDME